MPANADSVAAVRVDGGGGRKRDQGKLFYEFRLEDRIPKGHLLRRMNGFVAVALSDLHKTLEPFYSEIGRPSVDPELMIRMSGARDEFHLAAIVQNLKTMALRLLSAPPNHATA